MATKTFVIGAGSYAEYQAMADFVRVLSTSGPVDIEYYDHGVMVNVIEQIEAGYAEQFAAPFDRLIIRSATAQSVKLVTSVGGRVTYDRVIGNMTLLSQTTMVNAQKTVTNASGQLLAANAARRSLMIQNNDAAGNIYVRFDGAAATVATGLRLRPNGGFILLDTVVPISAITAIGDIASNANVIAVEG